MEDRVRQKENFQQINQTINQKKASNVSTYVSTEKGTI